MKNKTDHEAAIREALERGAKRYRNGGTVTADDLAAAKAVVERAMYQGLLAQGILEGLIDLAMIGGRLHFALNSKALEIGLEALFEDRPKH